MISNNVQFILYKIFEFIIFTYLHIYLSIIYLKIDNVNFRKIYLFQISLSLFSMRGDIPKIHMIVCINILNTHQ